MAEPSRRRRRRSYGSESTPLARGPNIHGWISDDGKHEEYLQMWKERKILRQKFVDLNWFTTHQFQFSQQLIEQGVQHLLQLQGCYYPDLVRVFYYNLKSQNAKETLSVELVIYCYGDRGIAGSSLVCLRRCLEEEVHPS
ncbi:hypothetical protein LR48_Vigan05g061000 [Vigna angularis]|uniref:Uncharacterized protein n=1 Tax=Phaseolus angularis TaxID=3914 RepID=A0A0L9UK02_PHAAN|nr:hypothetical protein LR48_Vigan05g061000 [Vigna angularis]